MNNVRKKTFIKMSMFICFSLFISCCKLFNTDEPSDKAGGEEPAYTAKIAWKSDTTLVEFAYTIMDEGAIYLFDGAAMNSLLMGHILVKLDAQTGRTIWKTDMGNPPEFTPLVIIENYIYVNLPVNGLYCFDKRDGALVARALFDIDNQSLEIYRNVTAHENFLYFGIGNYSKNNYFARVDTNRIVKDGGQTEQHIEPEVIWRPVYDRAIVTKPAFHNGIVYIHSFGRDGDPVELAGINLTTKAIEFNKEYGLAGDGEYYDNGWNYHSLYIHEDILYYIGSMISAYNLKTVDRDCLYSKIFSPEMPQKEFYSSVASLDVTFHNGRIYYTSEDGNPFGDHDYRNIHCIDAKTGNLVWNDISVNSEGHGTNPIIANNRMYVPEGNGLRVYEPDTGRLIGVDKSFSGFAGGRNFLYGDLMITTLRGNKIHPLVAIDVSK
jgi:outer membrane protein assembly factor BamB